MSDRLLVERTPDHDGGTGYHRPTPADIASWLAAQPAAVQEEALRFALRACPDAAVVAVADVRMSTHGAGPYARLSAFVRATGWHGRLTAAEVCDAAGLTPTSDARKAVARLAEVGKLRRFGRGRATRFEVPRG